MPQQLWQPSTSSIPSALLAHLLSFRFSILDQEKNAELWQLCLVSIHPNCPILVPTILTTFITFSTFQPWNDSHSRAMPAEQESSGNFQFSNWHESGVGYSYHRRLIVQYIKHCQRALPKLIVPFGNVLYIEYIATLARLALSKLNQIKNTMFKSKKKSCNRTTTLVKSHYLSKSHPPPSWYRKPFFKQPQQSRVTQRRVIPPVLSIHLHNISTNGWISKRYINRVFSTADSQFLIRAGNW